MQRDFRNKETRDQLQLTIKESKEEKAARIAEDKT